MSASLKKLTSKTNRLAVAIDGEADAITIEYSTRKLTPRIQQQHAEMALASAQDPSLDPDGQKLMISQFLSMVVGWDLRPDEGEPILSLTEDVLMDVPIEILVEIMDALTTEVSALLPKETTAT